MKFGETLYERSVPQWAAYNVNYDEIKQLIKRRTTRGIAEPVPIPGASVNRWEELEDELYILLKAQHDNVALFLRSKYGEVGRRLAHSEKQIRAAQRTLARPDSRRAIQTRRFHRLLQDADQIGEDIQALSRFTSVQKTAFRKILKKYRKWTHSIELQTRLERDVFSARMLYVDLEGALQQLSQQTQTITDILHGAMLQDPSTAQKPRSRIGSPISPVAPTVQIAEATEKSSLSFDASIATVPFGKLAGSATYWIHPDNLEEARTMILRHMRDVNPTPTTSRHSSVASIPANEHSIEPISSDNNLHMVFLDNAQRFVQDQSVSRPSKIAVTGRWSQSSAAVVTLSDLATWGSKSDIIHIRRKDLLKAVGRIPCVAQGRKSSTVGGADVARVQDYLSEHRDVKLLGEVHLNRSRYVGSSNSSQVGTWATLDTNITFAPCKEENIGSKDVVVESGEVFPHAVLEIRWEFGRTPQIVRSFDASHLAESVPDFSLECAVVFAADTSLGSPKWKATLERDIRKVPVVSRANRNKAQSRVIGFSSGPSSTDEPADSVFSAAAAHSSVTSEGSREASPLDMSSSTISTQPVSKPTKKKAVAELPSPQKPQQRYWNEFDDGDSDVNPQDTYTIYVDPNESLPGSELFSSISTAIQQSVHTVAARIRSLVSSQPRPEMNTFPTERTRLVLDTSPDTISTGSSTASSSPLEGPKLHEDQFASDTLSRRLSVVYRAPSIMTRRQAALERTYLQFYSGLLTLGYILLFMSALIMATGRKKARLEVDAGVVCGIVAAEVCAVISMVLACVRIGPLGVVQWGIVSVATTGIVVIGLALLVGVIESTGLQ